MNGLGQIAGVAGPRTRALTSSAAACQSECSWTGRTRFHWPMARSAPKPTSAAALSATPGSMMER